jgi:hypothetical protein
MKEGRGEARKKWGEHKYGRKGSRKGGTKEGRT